MLLSLVQKIIFCCIHGRALVTIRHKCGFALRLFDVNRQDFIKVGQWPERVWFVVLTLLLAGAANIDEIGLFFCHKNCLL